MSGPGGVIGDTVLNVVCGIRYEKDKKGGKYREEACGKSRDEGGRGCRADNGGVSYCGKLETIEDDYKKVEDVGKITKPRMEVMILMYRKTVKVQTAKDTLWLDCIVDVNASGFLNKGVVV